MNVYKTFLVFLIVAIPCVSFSQKKWERLERKAEVALEKGKYDKAHRKARKLERKTKKKLGELNEYLPFVEKVKAEFALQEGRILDYRTHIGNITTISDTLFGTASTSYAFHQFQSAKLLAEGGYVKAASEKLMLSKDIYQQDDWPEDMRAAMIVLEAHLLVEMGQYTQALELIEKESAFMETYGNYADTDKEDVKLRTHQLASFINISARALLERGSVSKANSVLRRNKATLSNALPKNDWAKVDFELIKAQVYENINEQKKAEGGYKKAYALSLKKRKPYDKRVIPYYEALIEAYRRAENTKKGQKETKNYLKLTRKAFKKERLPRLASALAQANMDFKEGELKKAERQLSKIEGSKLLKGIHPISISVSALRYELYLHNNKFGEAYKTLQDQIKSSIAIYGKQGTRFHELEMKKAAHLFHYTDSLQEAGTIIAVSYDGFLEAEITPQHANFVALQNQLVQFYRELDQFDKALVAMKASADASLLKVNNSATYGQQLIAFADLLFATGKIDESEKYLESAEKILHPLRFQQENAQSYAKLLYQQARLMSLKGDFDLAEDLLEDAEKYLRKMKGKNNPDNADFLQLLAEIAQSSGQYAEAEQLLTKAIAAIHEKYGSKTRRSLGAERKLAQLSLTLGAYTKASTMANQIEAAAIDIYGAASLKAASSLLLKSQISAAFGDYQTAARDMQVGLDIYTSVLGAEHLEIARIEADLALALLNGNGGKEQVSALLAHAMQVTHKQLGKESPAYADLLTYQAYLDIATGKYPPAFEKLSVAEEIWKSKSGKKNNANAAAINVLLGDVYYKLRTYKMARQHYQKSIKLYEKYFNEQHPDYIKVLAKISRLEYMEGHERKAVDLIETVMAQYETYLQEFFPILSEREKARFWNMIKEDYEFYNSLILKSAKNFEDKKIATLYDNAINTKSFLLNTSIRLRQNILESGDEELIQNFNEWTNSKELLARILTLSPQELNSQNFNKDSLIKTVENYEKLLSSQSQHFDGLTAREKITWQDIKSSLKENEVAIEMIRFRHFDHVFTDSVIYGALLLRNQKRSDKPEIVIFEDGENLENKFYKGYKNNMVFRFKDEISYEKFWKPIEDKIEKSMTIYFSPDGVFNRINLDAIPSPDGRFIVDNFNIKLLSSTKDLNRRREISDGGNNNAMLYGDPQFYADAALTSNDKKIVSLPGTHEEVQGISSLFLAKGWRTNIYLEAEAEETQVKNMSNPKVFHIATHGFYKPIQHYEETFNFGEINTSDNPLLRSGLMLKGAGDIIAQTSHNYNMEEGILTAYEAMNLNLSQTELVVLSACETGVGDVGIGEGVYGLQRAFLVAGAKVLITSLFKVNDEITKTLMINFYTRWLETGNIRNAFAEARNVVRAKHPDPIHWGAFIIYGLE